MPTAELPGISMWYDERGRGDPCVLLHPGGAGVDSRALVPTVDALSQVFHAYTPEQRAHGRTPDVDGPVSYELMAQDTIMFIEGVIGQPVYLLGVSDGAVVALMVARRRPDLVRRLVFVAGVFHHDGWEEGVLDDEPPEFLRQSYGELSPDGIAHYGVVVAKLAAMHASEPALSEADLRKIAMRTLVMIGDDDQVRPEHAIAMYRNLPDAELAIVPGTSHGLLAEKPALCNELIAEFLTRDPVQALAPIRRAPALSRTAAADSPGPPFSRRCEAVVRSRAFVTFSDDHAAAIEGVHACLTASGSVSSGLGTWARPWPAGSSTLATTSRSGAGRPYTLTRRRRTARPARTRPPPRSRPATCSRCWPTRTWSGRSSRPAC